MNLLTIISAVAPFAVLLAAKFGLRWAATHEHRSPVDAEAVREPRRARTPAEGQARVAERPVAGQRVA